MFVATSDSTDDLHEHRSTNACCSTFLFPKPWLPIIYQLSVWPPSPMNQKQACRKSQTMTIRGTFQTRHSRASPHPSWNRTPGSPGAVDAAAKTGTGLLENGEGVCQSCIARKVHWLAASWKWMKDAVADRLRCERVSKKEKWGQLDFKVTLNPCLTDRKRRHRHNASEEVMDFVFSGMK